MKRTRILAYASFMFIMIALGASDALRGVFSLIFQEHFVLSNTQVSMIVTISYVGNLVFLLIGGSLADRYSHKRVALAVMLLWMAAVIFYLITDNYVCLLIGMFFSMGASTLMNTMINIMTPFFFAGAPAMIINTLYFTQGIGTTGSQRLAGMFADSFGSWKVTNGILLAIGFVGVIFLVIVPYQQLQTRVGSQTGKAETTKKAGNAGKKALGAGFAEAARNPAFLYLVLLLGFYFVAEHGILNWLVKYGVNELQMTQDTASLYLALFSGGMCIGRLIFAPLVQKFGIPKSISLFGGVGLILYLVGVGFGGSTIILISAAGLFLSILYPTLIMMIQGYYPAGSIATATGLIISVATLFDIAFNACYGVLIDGLGMRISFLILPICMLLFYLMYQLFRIRVKPLAA